MYVATPVVCCSRNTACQDLKLGDIETDTDKRTLHEEYPLAKENEVFSGSDSMVKRVTIRKKVYKAKEKVQQCGREAIMVSTGVHRLKLTTILIKNSHTKRRTLDLTELFVTLQTKDTKHSRQCSDCY